MRQYLCLFILICFASGIIAPACGFLWGGKYSVIEICTAKGMESRIVADNQSPDQHPSDTEKKCEFCFQNAHFASQVPSAPVFEKIAFTSTKIRFDLYEDILLSRTRTATSARGPPLLV